MIYRNINSSPSNSTIIPHIPGIFNFPWTDDSNKSFKSKVGKFLWIYSLDWFKNAGIPVLFFWTSIISFVALEILVNKNIKIKLIAIILTIHLK